MGFILAEASLLFAQEGYVMLNLARYRRPLILTLLRILKQSTIFEYFLPMSGDYWIDGDVK